MIFAYTVVIGCSLMHIFCCGVPLLTTIVGLGSVFGVFATGVLENSLFENFENFENEILIISGLILLLAFILKLQARKLECCNKEEKRVCGFNEKINNICFKASLSLYALSIAIFFLS